MSIEKSILIAIWTVCVPALLTGVPKRRYREAVLVFVTSQTLTWSISLLFVEWKWIQNPVREFQKATAVNFTFNFILFPTVTVFYSLFYPKTRSRPFRIGYTVLYIGCLMAFLTVMHRYTELARVVPLYRYAGTGLVFLGVLQAVHRYKNWFFSAEPAFRDGRRSG
ncbi:hypothetical protein O9H85_16555 [Paenibacillus filicis]|uniref:Histidine kinase N-terminal 7TM region domain-containing protein n=1 Tax=Paenibacillus gyeongsangnamensis TaxID=3388067 RepID=A0ABT4QB11_9BACL|nr:CBO0543 family protein [Paenibacillus filicis]MCZ8514004.1 hypothetical protein [Paenibacillus filicis]